MSIRLNALRYRFPAAFRALVGKARVLAGVPAVGDRDLLARQRIARNTQLEQEALSARQEWAKIQDGYNKPSEEDEVSLAVGLLALVAMVRDGNPAVLAL